MEAKTNFDVIGKTITDLISHGHTIAYDPDKNALTVKGDLTRDVKGAINLSVENGYVRSNVMVPDHTLTIVATDQRQEIGIDLNDTRISARNIRFGYQDHTTEWSSIDGAGTIVVQEELDAENAFIQGNGLEIQAKAARFFDVTGQARITADHIHMVGHEDNVRGKPVLVADTIHIEEDLNGTMQLIATESITSDHGLVGKDVEIFLCGETGKWSGLQGRIHGPTATGYNFAKPQEKEFIRDAFELIAKFRPGFMNANYPKLGGAINADVARKNGLAHRL